MQGESVLFGLLVAGRDEWAQFGVHYRYWVDDCLQPIGGQKIFCPYESHLCRSSNSLLLRLRTATIA